MKHQRDIEAGTKHASQRMNTRKRLLLLALIMITACVIVLKGSKRLPLLPAKFNERGRCPSAMAKPQRKLSTFVLRS